MPRPFGFKFKNCPRGHKLSGDNLYVAPSGMRQCRACSRRRRIERRETILEQKRQWHRRNAKRINAKRREIAKLPENKKRQKEWAKIAYKKDPEKAIKRAVEWNKTNTKRRKRITARWQKNNPDHVRAGNSVRRTRITKAGGKFTAKEFKDLCKLYKHLCLRCGKKKKLTADHVVPVSKGGTSNIKNIQPLCMPCNTSKGTKCIDYR